MTRLFKHFPLDNTYTVLECLLTHIERNSRTSYVVSKQRGGEGGGLNSYVAFPQTNETHTIQLSDNKATICFVVTRFVVSFFTILCLCCVLVVLLSLCLVVSRLFLYCNVVGLCYFVCTPDFNEST